MKKEIQVFFKEVGSNLIEYKNIFALVREVAHEL